MAKNNTYPSDCPIQKANHFSIEAVYCPACGKLFDDIRKENMDRIMRDIYIVDDPYTPFHEMGKTLQPSEDVREEAEEPNKQEEDRIRREAKIEQLEYLISRVETKRDILIEQKPYSMEAIDFAYEILDMLEGRKKLEKSTTLSDKQKC